MRQLIAGLLIALPLSMPAAAQTSCEERVRELEAQLAEARRAGGTATGDAAAGVPCRRLSVLSVWAQPEAPLTVAVNGSTVGAYDGSAAVNLEGFLRPGTNTVRLSYATASGGSTEAQLMCLPPNQRTRTAILKLKPSTGRLQAEAQVNFTGR